MHTSSLELALGGNDLIPHACRLPRLIARARRGQRWVSSAVTLSGQGQVGLAVRRSARPLASSCSFARWASLPLRRLKPRGCWKPLQSDWRQGFTRRCGRSVSSHPCSSTVYYVRTLRETAHAATPCKGLLHPLHVCCSEWPAHACCCCSCSLRRSGPRSMASTSGIDKVRSVVQQALERSHQMHALGHSALLA